MADNTFSVDFDEFRKETGLEEDTVKDLYQGFLEELLEEKEKLLVQVQDREYVRLGRTVHNIKGISSSYQAQTVFRHAQELDSLLKLGKTENADVLANKLANDIIEAAGDIVRFFRL